MRAIPLGLFFNNGNPAAGAKATASVSSKPQKEDSGENRAICFENNRGARATLTIF
jgi:hypothetical protein